LDSNLNNFLLAIITKDLDKVKGGGCPVFKASDDKEMRNISLLLARITGGIVHDLENEVFIIVRH
jgi:hypothetical protein